MKKWVGVTAVCALAAVAVVAQQQRDWSQEKITTQQVSGNARVASADLRALRAEVDATLRKVSGVLDEINRKWPFERNTEIRLP